MTSETIAELQAEFAALTLPRFAEAEALALGQILLELAHGLPVVINIRTTSRVYFHAALPGSAPLYDLWARRKSNAALVFGLPSLLIGEIAEHKDQTLELHGLSLADHSDHGGAVPVQVAGCGVVACATVSGLPSVEDHRLVVQAITRLAAQLRG